MRHNLYISTLSCLLFNTAIAGLLTAIHFEDNFWINLVFSQCIGLSIYGINATVLCRIANSKNRWLVLVLTFPGSVLFGISLALWLTGVGSWNDPRAWVSVVIGLFFGGIGGITYFLSERIERLDAEVKQRQLQQSETERREVEAQLKLLQAQIEPHFLFNTLANVSSLIDSDPPLAKRLLERLNDWLRVALLRARSDHATLGDELDMLENYLQILAVRFGNRLHWNIVADHTARQHPFPPMLLQPLVENAVRHGMEPKIGSTTLHILASLNATTFQIRVIDDGAGLGENIKPGAGLENIRARLQVLYGSAGQLSLQSNPQGGVTATLVLPQ
jgi:sensor histidine kinase YesM